MAAFQGDAQGDALPVTRSSTWFESAASTSAETAAADDDDVDDDADAPVVAAAAAAVVVVVVDDDVVDVVCAITFWRTSRILSCRHVLVGKMSACSA